jgi:hypothetical protein
MTEHPYHNEAATPAEKLLALHRETLAKKREGTMMGLALAESQQSGRFGAQTQMKVVGTEPEYQVPRQPPHSPWSQQWPEGGSDDVTGYDVNAMEPVGSQAEIEHAAQILRDREERKSATRSLADPMALTCLVAPSADAVAGKAPTPLLSPVGSTETSTVPSTSSSENRAQQPRELPDHAARGASPKEVAPRSLRRRL